MTPRRYAVSKIVLTSFRNHAFLKLDVSDAPVVINGANGAGKTSVLEAISLFGAGRGLRGASAGELPRRHGGETAAGWGAAAFVTDGGAPVKIAVGPKGASGKMFYREEAPVAKAEGIAPFFRVIWHTPALQHKICDNASERRKWFDGLTAAAFPEHERALRGYEYYMRERLRLLKQGCADDVWLSRLEAEAAERGAAVCARRAAVTEALRRASAMCGGAFPHAFIRAEGEAETLGAGSADEDIKALWRNAFRARRQDDMRAGRAGFGAGKTDIAVYAKQSGLPLGSCSAGEQKALIFHLLLCFVRYMAKEHGITPVLLLDEALSQLDADRAEALCEELNGYHMQYWLTDTDTGRVAALRDNVYRITL